MLALQSFEIPSKPPPFSFETMITISFLLSCAVLLVQSIRRVVSADEVSRDHIAVTILLWVISLVPASLFQSSSFNFLEILARSCVDFHLTRGLLCGDGVTRWGVAQPFILGIPMLLAHLALLGFWSLWLALFAVVTLIPLIGSLLLWNGTASDINLWLAVCWTNRWQTMEIKSDAD